MTSIPAAQSGDRALTLADVLQLATVQLRDAGDETARLDAEVLLRHVLEYDRTSLFLNLPNPASPDVQSRFRELIRQRLDGQPVAYIVGSREFMGLQFGVSDAVLVPRPETELLVEWAQEQIAHREFTTIADIGTGSGAIALSLAQLVPAERDIRIIATDVSPEAIETAQSNLRRVVSPELQRRVTFRTGDLASPITEPVDLVLANLPYLRPSQIAENPDLAPEPRLALDGGEDGLDLVRRLIADMPRIMKRYGSAGFEIDPCGGDQVIRLLSLAYPAQGVRKIFDLAGHTRHIVLEGIPLGLTSRRRTGSHR